MNEKINIYNINTKQFIGLEKSNKIDISSLLF